MIKCKYAHMNIFTLEMNNILAASATAASSTRRVCKSKTHEETSISTIKKSTLIKEYEINEQDIEMNNLWTMNTKLTLLN